MTALATLTLPRPLPRSLAPRAEETLSGYLLNLAHRLGARPIDLALRVGLEHTTSAASIDSAFAVSLSNEVAARFAHACNLTADETAGLTLTRWDGLLLGLPRLQLTRRVWLSSRGSGQLECLVLDGCEASQSALSASAVVGPFDPGDDRQPQVLPGCPALPVEHVLLQ